MAWDSLSSILSNILYYILYYLFFGWAWGLTPW